MINYGLTSQEAEARLKTWGYNEITSNQILTFITEVKKILLDPMGIMLLSLSILYWLLDDRSDSIILFIAYFPVTAIDVILEVRSGRALRALKETLTPVAKVIRDGKIQELPTRNLVPDDILVFEEGQTLAADGLLIEAHNLNINEAALTGESLPVIKEVGEDFFAGTTVITGRAIGKIVKTGKSSRYGSIAKLLGEVEEGMSPLRKTVDRLVKIVVTSAILFAGVLFSLEWVQTHKFIPSLIKALTLGMAAVPEEFPMVFTLYLSLGALRLSKKGVLVKSLPSVEILGGVDVICTDKTGTLTKGIFQLSEIKLIDETLPQDKIWQLALMACELHAVDSMEMAIHEKGQGYLRHLDGWGLVYDYAFEPLGKHMSHVWRNDRSDEQIIAMKGAVEGVIEHCEIDSSLYHKITELTNLFANEGKRILGLAGRYGGCTGVRENDEKKLKFIGLMVFADPVRSAVRESIQNCQKAGIEVKMLTGDHLLTAHAVAEEIGLTHSHEFIYSGDKLGRMTEEERRQAYIKGAIFARVRPEQKHEMVKALKNYGHIVAMTGDGINDAPALRLADIGISMGKSATDVARSTAKMVLMQNDFSGIVSAIFEGRKIFSNLRRSFSYLIAFHIPVVLLALIPPFLKWPSVLLPIHIILLELIVHPVSAFTFENINESRLEKNRQRNILSKNQILRSVVAGILLTVFALLGFSYYMNSSLPLATAFAMAIVVLGNIFLVLGNIFPEFNLRFIITGLSLALALLALTSIEYLQALMHFSDITYREFFLAMGLGALASLPLYERRNIK